MRASSSRFIEPMPCSAENDPPNSRHHRMHGVVHVAIERQEADPVRAHGLRYVVVQIAVAHMAEARRTRASAEILATALSACSMKAGMAETGTEISCLIEAPSGFCAQDISSRISQKAACCARFCATAASGEQTCLETVGQDFLHQRPRVLRRAAGRDLGEHIPRDGAPPAGSVRALLMPQHEVERIARTQLEGGQRGARAVVGAPEKGRARPVGCRARFQASSLPFGLGTSFSTAAVMMPSVPSAPTKRFLRS